MNFAALIRPFSSFRAQMVAFITGILLLTSLGILLLNQNLERRNTRVIDEYIQSIPGAIDLAYRSLSEGQYLYDLVNRPETNSLPINSESVIRHILVVEGDGKIFDSTNRIDLGQKLETVINNQLPDFEMGDLKHDIHSNGRSNGRDESRSIRFSIETQKADGSPAKRNIIIVISMNRLQRVKDAGDRARLLAFVILGLVLIIAIAVFTKRFTRPITELEQGAQRVTRGNLDFRVPVSGPKEMSTLSTTFNEMLTGLRRNRELEEQLQRAERSAVVGRLASGIAHEIRNPLNFINLSIDHLREKFAPQSAGPRAEYTHILVTIKDELARLNRLVSDFLSYGRPAKLKLREIDAGSLIEEVRDLVAAQSEQQNIKITIKMNGQNGGHARLRADAEQLKTCFSNLMINAIQAMPEGGALDVTLWPNDFQIEIDFTDTGPGIPAEAQEQIFEPYYSTKETGIGLGLPLTRKIIEEHGGQIDVKSELGKGATFTVTLPK